MKQLMLIIFAALIFSGCQPRLDRTEWRLERKPTTEAERKAIAAHVEKVLAATPKSLSGHDQDWDDAINAAESSATELFSRPVLREWRVTWDGWKIEPTGKWRYADEGITTVVTEREERYSDALKEILQENYSAKETRIFIRAVLKEWDK